MKSQTGISETQWQKMVIQIAKTFGWIVHHVRANINRSGRWSTAVQGDVGFPDLVLCHEATGDLIFAELKSATGKPSPAQFRWLNALNLGPERLSYVWYPSDFDEVRERLMVHHRGPRCGDDAKPVAPVPGAGILRT